MSCSRECQYIETKKGEWFLLLARFEHGSLESGQADAFGPFSSEKEATNYLSRNFSNPGGAWFIHEKSQKLSPLAKKMIKNAISPIHPRNSFRF